MPNFWSTATQKIYEVLYGPRTRDVEFDQKVEELKYVMGAMQNTRNIIKSFPQRTAGIQEVCREVYNNFKDVYGESVVYSPFIRDVCDAHKDIERAFLACCETLNSLQQMTDEWDKLFAEVNDNLNKRKSAREIYDHYDQKMEDLVRERNDKLSRHVQESVKEIEKFDRNDGKYKRAANDLIQLSNYTYKLIQDLLDYRYRLLNPMVITFISEEKKFFDACSSYFRKFDNLSQKVAGLERGFQKTPINYDPTKHIRATRLLIGVNPNDLPQVVKKDKYTYEDYKKKAGLGGQNTGGNNGGFNNNFRSNTFSNTSSTGYVNPYANNNNQNQFGNSNNQTSSAAIANPFSYEAYRAKTKTMTKTSFNDSSVKSNQFSDNNQFSKPKNNNPPPSQMSQSYMPGMKNFDFNFNNNPPSNNFGGDVNPYASISFNELTPPPKTNNNFSNNNQANNNFSKNFSTMDFPSNPLGPPSNDFPKLNEGPSNDFSLFPKKDNGFPMPEGNKDYLKFSNIKDGQKGGFNSDFPQ